MICDEGKGIAIMTDAIRELFNDYEFHTEAGASLIEKYGGRLPTQILDLWKTYGFGVFYEGYLKMVDPDEYKEQIARMYVNGEKAIPVFITCFGDAIVWEGNSFFNLILFKDFRTEKLADSFENLCDDLLCHRYDKIFDMDIYHEFISGGRSIAYEKCLISMPLSYFSGGKKEESLFQVKIPRLFDVIQELLGVVGKEQKELQFPLSEDYKSYYIDPSTLKISRAQFIQEMETEQWNYKMHYSIDISSQEKTGAEYVLGCFCDRATGKWIAYEMLDRGMCGFEKAFDTEEEALGEVKKRVLNEIENNLD